jgi:DNA polymerase III epsilon subunit-like protein
MLPNSKSSISSKIPIDRTAFLSLGYGRSKYNDWSGDQLREMSVSLGLSKKGNKKKLYEQIAQAFDSNPKLIVEISREEEKVKVPAKKKSTYDCYSKNRPLQAEDGSTYCPPNKPYLSQTKNGFDCCYAKPRYASIKKIKHQMGEEHDQQIKRLVKAGYLRHPKVSITPGVDLEKTYGITNFKIIIYDLETSGLPYGNNYPDITQIAMYAPQTDEYYMSYSKPDKPIDPGASEVTGIYSTFEDQGRYYNGYQWIYRNPFMNSSNYREVNEKYFPQFYHEMNKSIESIQTVKPDELALYVKSTGILNQAHDLVDLIVEDINGMPEYKFVRENMPYAAKPGEVSTDHLVQFVALVESDDTLMDIFLGSLSPNTYTKLSDAARKFAEQNIKAQYFGILHDMVTKEVVSKHHTVSLSDERPFSELTDEIRDFIIKDTDPDTIILMVAHNGQAFDEPVLKDSFNRAGRSFYLTDNILFVDSYLMALTWIAEHKTENYKLGTLYKNFLGEEMPGWHDAKADVTGLWKMIEGLFDEVFGTKDPTFIAMKMLEFYFSSQLIDEDYLESTAKDIFRSKEFTDIYRKPKKLPHGKYHQSPY